IAALLHDIGRARTHSILHGIAGAEILREHGFDERYQRVCERHIGAGISSKEAKELGLPERNYFPETLEEKIIAQADNLIDSRKRKSFKKVYKDFQKKFGKDSEIVMRFLKLQEELERLMR
ncbi:MAG: HD domain-containing protein, partial [Candidatus Methanofastidiosia archaeon]